MKEERREALAADSRLSLPASPAADALRLCVRLPPVSTYNLPGFGPLERGRVGTSNLDRWLRLSARSGVSAGQVNNNWSVLCLCRNFGCKLQLLERPFPLKRRQRARHSHVLAGRQNTAHRVCRPSAATRRKVHSLSPGRAKRIPPQRLRQLSAFPRRPLLSSHVVAARETTTMLTQ